MNPDDLKRAAYLLETMAFRTDDTKALAARLRAAAERSVRDREADRARFSDAAFNRWLDEAISDSGHIVWHTIPDVSCAWAAWESCPFYTAPPIPQGARDALQELLRLRDANYCPPADEVKEAWEKARAALAWAQGGGS